MKKVMNFMAIVSILANAGFTGTSMSMFMVFMLFDSKFGEMR